MTTTSAGRRPGLPSSLPRVWPVRQRGRVSPGEAQDGASGGSAPTRGIRSRRPRDLPACVRLMRVVFHVDRYPDEWPDAPRAWLGDVHEAWVAERHGQILGHVAISPVGQGDHLSAARWTEVTGHHPDRLAGVSRLFVRPSSRHQGIGTGLVDVAVQAINARGLVPVVEVVSPRRDGVRFLQDGRWQLAAMDPRDRSGRLQVYRYAARRS